MNRWDGITAMYEKSAEAPVRLALEMRLMGGSNVILAPQYKNEATASIEVLTHQGTPPEAWADFKQHITDKWTSYKDKNGQFLNARPHWAKEWKGLRVHGQPIEDYMRETAYKEAFSEFRTVFARVVENNKCSVEETLNIFGNDTMKDLIFGGNAKA
jgi:hypothetical protein